jgi:hypothetical protein
MTEPYCVLGMSGAADRNRLDMRVVELTAGMCMRLTVSFHFCANKPAEAMPKGDALPSETEPT